MMDSQDPRFGTELDFLLQKNRVPLALFILGLPLLQFSFPDYHQQTWQWAPHCFYPFIVLCR